MTPTLRRLNDRERYWGLTWPGWAAGAVGGGVLYGAAKLSPLGIKPTVTIVALLLATIVVIGLGASGQALSPGRHLLAVTRHHRQPKQWALPDDPPRRGLTLSTAPDLADAVAVGLGSGGPTDDLVAELGEGWGS